MGVFQTLKCSEVVGMDWNWSFDLYVLFIKDGDSQKKEQKFQRSAHIGVSKRQDITHK